MIGLNRKWETRFQKKTRHNSRNSLRKKPRKQKNLWDSSRALSSTVITVTTFRKEKEKKKKKKRRRYKKINKMSKLSKNYIYYPYNQMIVATTISKRRNIDKKILLQTVIATFNPPPIKFNWLVLNSLGHWYMLKRKNIMKNKKSTIKRVLNLTRWKEINKKSNNSKQSKEIRITEKKKRLSKDMNSLNRDKIKIKKKAQIRREHIMEKSTIVAMKDSQ